MSKCGYLSTFHVSNGTRRLLCAETDYIFGVSADDLLGPVLDDAGQGWGDHYLLGGVQAFNVHDKTDFFRDTGERVTETTPVIRLPQISRNCIVLY